MKLQFQKQIVAQPQQKVNFNKSYALFTVKKIWMDFLKVFKLFKISHVSWPREGSLKTDRSRLPPTLSLKMIFLNFESIFPGYVTCTVNFEAKQRFVCFCF